MGLWAYCAITNGGYGSVSMIVPKGAQQIQEVVKLRAIIIVIVRDYSLRVPGL